jgi:response regulator NasT
MKEGHLVKTDFKVLLVSDEVANTHEIEEGLRASGITQVKLISTEANVLSALNELAADLIVLDVKKPSMALFEQFSIVHELCPRPVVCFSSERDSKVIAKSVKAGVTAYIVDGRDANRIRPIIDVAMARFNECFAVRKELAQVKDKLSERAVIERAKGLLIEHKQMTEDQAYQAMRKMAMDQGKKISIVAHEICGVVAIANKKQFKIKA